MYRRIRDMREDRDLYQKDIAEYLCYSEQWYKYYSDNRKKNH